MPIKTAAIFLAILLVLAGSSWHELFHKGQPIDHVYAAEKQQYTCGMHPFIIQDEPGTCPICAMDLTPVKSGSGSATTTPDGERKIKYWVAPMDPSYIREEPGKSPMGMDLIPIYEDEAAVGSVIRIDPVTQQNMGVRFEPVSYRNLQRTIGTVGIVGYEEPKQYSVNSKIDGWIEKLHVNETGKFVKKGDPLLEIYSPELVAAQEEFLLALRNSRTLQNSAITEISAGAKRLADSARKRLLYWDITDKQIKELERSGETKKALVLYAPYDGVITEKKGTQGMFTKAGMELFQISDISRVWVYADIYEYELPWVSEGQAAQIELPYSGTFLSGTVSTIYPYVDKKTRTIKARIDLDNPGFDLKPDMYVKVRLQGQTVQNVMTIPVEAVLYSGEKQRVFVALGAGKFEPRQVKLGLQGEDGFIEVIQGLFADESVVTSAQFMFDSESTLREAIKKMLAPKTAEPKIDDNEELGDLFDDKKENLDALFD